MWNVADSDQDGRDDDDAPHDPGAVRDPSAYWRRRFFFLGGGVALLGVCVWLFPGGHPTAPRASATAQASMAALAKQGVLPSAAFGSAWPGPTPTKTVRPGPSQKPSPSPSATHKQTKAGAHPVASPSPDSTATASGGSRCKPADIVVSLFTGEPSYSGNARPKFDVYAVSTSSAACTLSWGPGSVQVVVTRHGRVVWDSAACKLTPATPVRFTLGVPQVLTMTWNRQAGKPSGCAGSLPAGTRGTFDAVAMTHGQSSPVRSFKLSS
jgi:hypothetical protein